MRGGTCPKHIIFPSFCRILILLTHLLFWSTAIRTVSYNAATLHFIDVPPNISLPTVVQTLPGYKVTFLVTGTPPINTVILSPSAVFVDTTNTSVAVQLEEGNFVCVATNKFGFDLRMFSVTFSGKRLNLK